jgi:hypothetical protein
MYTVYTMVFKLLFNLKNEINSGNNTFQVSDMKIGTKICSEVLNSTLDENSSVLVYYAVSIVLYLPTLLPSIFIVYVDFFLFQVFYILVEPYGC